MALYPDNQESPPLVKAHTASLINAIVLIAVSIWGYLGADKASFTALIPAAFGVLLLACYKGVEGQNKIIAHIAAVLTVVILIALYTPLSAAIGRGDSAAIFRVGLMMASTLLALVFFVKSFIDARRSKA